MKVPIEWISEYLKIEDSTALADKLTMAGLEVEEIDTIEPGELVRAGGAVDDQDSRVMVTKVTPNRGDWLSMIGVAREASAVTGWKFTMPQPNTCDGCGEA
jgi:phenylalanyl-tRNA synthetase beta subunit